jgi:putative ABC transport system ATP-binding protein
MVNFRKDFPNPQGGTRLPHVEEGYEMEGSYSKSPILVEPEQSTEDGLVIETRGLVKDYIDGTNIIHVLRGVDLKIYRGEMVAIMGPSGSGKSTLLYVLGLLHAPTAGVYLFKGHDILSFTQKEQAIFRNKEVGFIFQSCDLLPNSTVFENLELPLIYAVSDNRTRRKKILDALDKVGLSHRVDHWANRLSGGERQRAAMARALVNNPSLILGDEPTGQLDQKNTDAVVEQLRSVARQGYAVALVTHEEEIGRACDRIIRIRDGSVVSDGREDLKSSEADSASVAVIELDASCFRQ